MMTTWTALKSRVRTRIGYRTYSQEGEDRVLERMLEQKPTGFYVDVGAHHPYRFSNTYLFYRRGWRGINIDAMPGSMAPFRKHRPRDVNLELAIGRQRDAARFFVFSDPALNTFDEELARERSQDGRWRIEAALTIPVRPLDEVLAEHLNPGQSIDFLTIDVEGHDLEALRSNDWQRFRPALVLTEVLTRPDEALFADPVTAFMRSVDYKPVAKTMNTCFFSVAGK